MKKQLMKNAGVSLLEPSSKEAQVWDEDTTRFDRRLVLKADSFRPEPLFKTVPSRTWYNGLLSPSDHYLYSNLILTAGQSLFLALSPMQEGTVEFDGDVIVPTLFDLTAGQPEPWMSITPQEIITHRPGINRASGTVVVGGLGLGWFLRKVHDREEVERVILVDNSQELLDWYGNDLCRRLPKVTDVICGDVYEQIGRFGARAKHLLDIWKGYGDCLLDERFRWHKRRYKHVWGWGEEVASHGLVPNHPTFVVRKQRSHATSVG